MEDGGKRGRIWLVFVAGLGITALVADRLFPDADLGDLGVVATVLVAALWARENGPLGPRARRIAVAVVGGALLGGIAVHLLAR